MSYFMRKEIVIVIGQSGFELSYDYGHFFFLRLLEVDWLCASPTMTGFLSQGI